MDDKKFLELCKAENSKLASIEVKEIPSDEIAFKSIIIVNSMLVDGVGDALLFAAALNVLNTYVKLSKENKKTVGYFFKNKVKVLFNYILKNPNENMDAEIQEDNGTSLGIVEIYGIQFSFHNLTVTEEMQSFKVKDPEHPRLPWDGIRKQQCSVSLFNFAYDNTFGRTNKKLDGDDFIAYINSLTDEFRAGTKKIEDVLHTGYKKDSSNVSDNSKGKIIIDEYPYRNRFFVSVNDYSPDALIEKIHSRTLVPELNDLYQKKTGQYLSYVNQLSAKYAFQSLLYVLKKDLINPTTGIKISYSKVPCREGFFVYLTSELSEGSGSTVCIELLNWTSAKEADDGYISVRDDYTGIYRTTRRPENHKLSDYLKIIENIPTPSVKIKDCVFLYDTVKCEENRAISDNTDEKSTVHIFYANDTEKLYEFIKPELESGNGGEILDAMNVFYNNMDTLSDGSLSYEHKISVESCIECIKAESSTLTIFNYRKVTGSTAFYDYTLDQLRSSGVAFSDLSSESVNTTSELIETAVFNDCIPDENVFDSFKHIIVLCDMYAPRNIYDCVLNDLIEYAYDNGINIHRSDIISGIGFSDGGNGNNFLLRSLGLSEIESRKYTDERYPIYLAKRKEELTEKDGLKNIIISEGIGYDFDSKGIRASTDEKEVIYEELLDAPSGVRLYAENIELSDYLEDLLARHANYEKKILDAKSSVDEDLAEVLKAAKKSSDNTSDYNKYLSMAIQCVHMDAWNKISESSQDWVVSGISSYYYMKNTDTSMDFSGVALLISKTFEVELGNRISVDYFEYIKNKYGDNYISELPEPLVKETQYGLKAQNPENTTLGSMTYIMGLDSEGRIVDKSSYEKFLVYCKDELLLKPENAAKDLAELCDIITYVRVKFRNTSAHKAAIPFEVATDCITYCITEKRKLGVVMDMFRK